MPQISCRLQVVRLPHEVIDSDLLERLDDSKHKDIEVHSMPTMGITVAVKGLGSSPRDAQSWV